MNRLLFNKSAIRIVAFSAACLLSMSLEACHDAKASEGASESSVADPRPDEQLKELMKSMAKDDAHRFAALCIYPIVRPYPLKDIEDSTAMIDYYPIMVDGTLRDRMAKAKLDDWESYGWRGWSIGDDTPIWFFDGIQSVDYLSAAELGLKNILSREELMTLAPQYREGWTPVMTLVESNGNGIIRIDSKGGKYRLMAFDDVSKVGNNPEMLMLGSLRHEGSADSDIYEFADTTGNKAEYSPDGETPEQVFIIKPGKTRRSIEVKPAYWRDVVKD